VLARVLARLLALSTAHRLRELSLSAFRRELNPTAGALPGRRSRRARE
jgi:hypothetical protein